VLLGVLGVALGTWLHWTELTSLAGVCLVAVAVAVPQLLRPRPAHVSLVLRPPTTVVGKDGSAVMTVVAGSLPLLTPTVSMTAAGERTRLRLPSVGRGGRHEETFALPARRRGVFTVGPVAHEVSDLLGLLRRRGTWAGEAEFLVRPRTVLLESLSTGVMGDLEGAPSARLSQSDLAFHALREYVHGDDLRHVHWRSSARQGSLLVRQYEETTRSHATVVLDDCRGSYGSDDDFELAVSVAASVALRAALDDFDVTWLTSVQELTSSVPTSLTDLACRITISSEAAPDELAERARRIATTAGGTSLVAVVSGAGADTMLLRDIASAFGAGPRRLVVRVDEDASSRVEGDEGVRVVRLSKLEHLESLINRDAP
jgi:hypothetical protein